MSSIGNPSTVPGDAVNGREKPPAYFDYREPDTDTSPKKEKKINGRPAPYSCVFTSTKGKVPHLHIFDTRKDRKAMEKMGFGKYANGQAIAPRRMAFKLPSAAKGNNGEKHIVIEINDRERENGCVIGLDVRCVDKETIQTMTQKTEAPMDLTIETLDLKEEKK